MEDASGEEEDEEEAEEVVAEKEGCVALKGRYPSPPTLFCTGMPGRLIA